MATDWDIEQAKRIPGWMDAEELEWLHQKARLAREVVEVGVWLGRSTCALLAGTAGKVFAVDHFQGSPSDIDGDHKLAREIDLHAEALKHIGHFPNLEILKMDSIEASKLFEPQSVDMVFIDGEHTVEAVLADLEAWEPKCRGLLCGHDVHYAGVIGALARYGVDHRRGPGRLWYAVEVINAAHA